MTANALTLSWTASSGTAPIFYQVNFRVAGASLWIPYGGAQIGLVLTVIGLSPLTSYDFQVVASNSAGSTTSAIATGTTLSSTNFPAPGTVTGNQTTGTVEPIVSGPQTGAVLVSTTLAVAGITLIDAAAAAASGSLIDSANNTWIIVATNGGQASRNGVTDTTTANIIEMAYVNGVIWSEDNAGNWRPNPSLALGGFGTATQTSPLPNVSPNNSFIIAGSGTPTSGAHRYWRLLMVSGISNAYDIAEMQFRSSVGTPQLFSGGTATAAQNYSDATGVYDAPKAADNDLNTSWSGNDSAPGQWWQYDYGSGNIIAVAQITMTTQNTVDFQQAPTSFTVQWSDNGTAWTSVITVNPTTWATGQTQTFAMPINVPSLTDTAGNVWTIVSSGGGQVARNGVTDTTSLNVIEMAWVGGVIWQENSIGDWYRNTTLALGGFVGPFTSPLPIIPPSVPVLTVSNPTNTTMLLSWNANTGSLPVNFQPMVRNVASGPSTTTRSATVTGLTANTSYDFEVLATNKGGSAKSLPVVQSTMQGTIPPSAPTNLVASVRARQTITYTWSAPTTGSTPISYQPRSRASGGVTGTRNYWDQPGTNKNFWNTPLGDGATWGGANDADTLSLRKYGGYINTYDNYGAVFWVSFSNSDPVGNFVPGIYTSTLNAGQTYNVHVPRGAYSAGPNTGQDQHFCFCDTVSWPGLYWQMAPCYIANSGGGFQGGRYDGPFGNAEDARTDNFCVDYDTGFNRTVQTAGVIRAYDLDPARNPARMPGQPNVTAIQHVLRFSLDAGALKGNADPNNGSYPNGYLLPNSWPALYQDYQEVVGSVSNVYIGNYIYGTHCGIPINTPMPAGLSTAGQQIFWAFQHYGGTPRDQGGGGPILEVDQDVSASWVSSGLNDMNTITSYLLPLRNQHKGGESFIDHPIQGPGNRVDVGPPELTSSTSAAQFQNFGGAIAQTTVTVTGLNPNTSYDFLVIASNNFGQATSTTVTTTTLP